MSRRLWQWEGRTWWFRPQGVDVIFAGRCIKLSANPDDPEAIPDGFYKRKDFPIAIGRVETKASYEIGRNLILRPEDIPLYVVESGRYAVAQ